MLKKILLPLLAAVLLAASFSGIAFAAEEDPPEIIKARGEVIAVDPIAGKFRLETPDGMVMTFFVMEDTNYRGKIDSLDDLEVGWKAAVRAREDEDGKLIAMLVLAGDLSKILKFRGEVTQVDPAAGKFRLQDPDGNVTTFFVNEKTRYGGQLSGLEDLQVGWKAGVAAREGEDGKLIAIGVIAGDAPKLSKAWGTVTAVDPGNGKFELERADGSKQRFFVDENTRYQGQLSSLDEMQIGWKAGVAAKEDQDGKLWAVLIIAGNRPEPIRTKGTVVGVDVGAGKFRLENSDGSVLTFFVDGKTRYKGQIQDLGDLEEGMRAGVAAFEDEDGNLLARLVIAGKPRSKQPPLGQLDPESEEPHDRKPFNNLSVPLESNL